MRRQTQSAETLSTADYFANARLSLVCNNMRLPYTFNNSANWVNNSWTKHRSGPAGFPHGVYATFINGMKGANTEQDALYDFNLRTGIHIPSQGYLFVRGVWETTASVDSLLLKEWGTDTAFYAVAIPPNTDFYITNRRVAADLGAAGTYGLITSHSGRGKRQDGIISGTDVNADFTLGVGVAYGGKLGAPVIGYGGVCTSIPAHATDKGFGYTAAALLTMDYGPALVNTAGALCEGTTSISAAFVSVSGGQVTGVGSLSGGAGANPDNPPTAYVGGGGLATNGFGGNTATYGPSSIYGAPDRNVISLFGIGDSIIAGYSSSDGEGDLFGNFGYFEQTTKNRANIMLFATSSANASNAATHLASATGKQIALLRYLAARGLRLDKLVITFGTNDFLAAASKAGVEASINSIINSIQAVFPEIDPYPVTIIPATTSTDSFVTVANQTAYNATYNTGGAVETYNAALRAGTAIPKAKGIVDLARAIADATAPTKFRVAGEFLKAPVTATAFTTDGFHPSVATGIPYLVQNLDINHLVEAIDTRQLARPEITYVPRVGGDKYSVKRKVLKASAVTLTNTTPANVVSVVVPPGRWEISSSLGLVCVGTTATSYKASVSKISVTHGSEEATIEKLFVIAATTQDIQEPVISKLEVEVPPGTTTTYYLVCTANFTVGTMTAFGTIKATAM